MKISGRTLLSSLAAVTTLVCLGGATARAQTATAQPRTSSAPPATPQGEAPPPDYVIGADDVLSIVFWRDKDMSADVVVRPDGRISLPLLNDVDVAGLTTDQVRERVTEAARPLLQEEPNATVVVKQINSRKVYITGQVERPGTFPLLRPTTILQLIALAGGLKEFAKTGDISVVRVDGPQQAFFSFNYDDVKNRKNLAQNILLKPGDTVIVP